MERLTEYQKAQKWLETYDWDNDKNADDNLATICEALQEIEKYKDLEEQGLLLRLPCKMGDTVWCVGNHFVCDYQVRRCLVDDTGIECIQIAKEIEGREYWNGFNMDNFGKTVFLTREEAEKALADMGV